MLLKKIPALPLMQFFSAISKTTLKLLLFIYLTQLIFNY